VSVTGAFGPEHTSLVAVFRCSLGFGTNEVLTLPPETVRELTFTGPSWLPAPEGRVEVTWVPEAHLPENCSVAQIHLNGTDGRRLASYQGSIRHAGSGSLGYSVELDFNLPWVAAQQISTHWLRHTTLTWVERNFSYAIARAYAGHTGKNDAGTTSTYVRADIEEVAIALAALVGEPHPVSTTANDTNSDASAGRLLLALEGN
jgi:hypothetical protein